ncbi:MAG: DUF4258 domain-containing protein [Oscillospiraceae bacterium]|nr:DUF4258 domain-containing protein [Oscillospiraceae bacterium]
MDKIDEIKINDLRALCRDDKIKFTLHALKRIRERKISSDKIIDAILSGEIIEQYQNDKYFPSCLIFNNNYNEPIHVVSGIGSGKVYIITAYNPTLNEWESDFKIRKENK